MGEVIGGNYISVYSGDQIDAILGKANAYPAATVEDAGKVPVVQDDGTIDWGEGGGSDTNLAPVESTSTASQAYAVNSFLIYNGQLYRVTAAIAQGDTLTVGTNIEAADAGTYLAMVASANAVASAGVAPGGFGLGGAVRAFALNDDLDSFTQTGWYGTTSNNISRSLLHAPPNITFYETMMLHETINSNYMRQTFVDLLSGVYAIRVKRGTWEPWEFVNPPLITGTEYRTTERFNGKPVYTQYKSVHAMETGAKTYPHGISNVDRFVNVLAYRFNGSDYFPLPEFYPDSSSVVGLAYSSIVKDITKTEIMFYDGTGNNPSSDALWYILAKYTKTTD